MSEPLPKKLPPPAGFPKCGKPMFDPSCAEQNPPPPPPDPDQMYNLPGAQVDPEAGWWGIPVLERELPRVVSIDRVKLLVENPESPFYVPPYPRDPAFLDWEISELAFLAANRDNPEALVGTFGPQPPAHGLPPAFVDTTRAPISDFIQLDPPPFGTIFNINPCADPDAPNDEWRCRNQFAINNINQQHLRRQQFQNGELPGVVRTGRQLARMFELDTPGHIHRHALNYLFYNRTDISPPRQARVWMALDVAIYSALIAAWYYKWAAPLGISYRQRPFEYDRDRTFRVLYDDEVDDCGLFNGCARRIPCPSPGSPRHPAYPSGHSTFSAAASGVLAYFFPEEAEQWRNLANNIGVARLWGGVHWRTDHVAGQRIGCAVAELVIRQLRGDCVSRHCATLNLPPPQETLAQSARRRRTAEVCQAIQDQLPPQREDLFPACPDEPPPTCPDEPPPKC